MIIKKAHTFETFGKSKIISNKDIKSDVIHIADFFCQKTLKGELVAGK